MLVGVCVAMTNPGFLEAMVDLITERVILSNAATAPLDELRLETRSNRAGKCCCFASVRAYAVCTGCPVVRS